MCNIIDLTEIATQAEVAEIQSLFGIEKDTKKVFLFSDFAAEALLHGLDVAILTAQAVGVAPMIQNLWITRYGYEFKNVA